MSVIERRTRPEHDRRLGVGSAEAEAQRTQEGIELGGVPAGDAQLVVGRTG